MAASESEAIGRIFGKLDEMSGVLTDIRSDFAEMKGEHSQCKGQMCQLLAAVNGNGKEGLLAKVARLEAKAPLADSVSVGSTTKLIAAVGALATVVAAAIATAAAVLTH